MSHSEVKCDMGIERGEIGLCIPRKIWVTVSKFEEFYVQKFDRCRVKHLSDRVELSTREWMLNQASYWHRKSPYTWVVADWPWNKQWPPYISTYATPPSVECQYGWSMVFNGALITQPCKVVSYRGHHGEIGIHFPLIPPVTVLFPGAAVSPCSEIPFWVRLSS